MCASAALGCSKLRDTPDRELSDGDVRALAAAPFDSARQMNESYRVGRHRGTPVLLQFPCGDVCPAYTTKVVRYDVEPSACPAHGEVLTIATAGGAAMILRAFCFPRILHVRGLPTRTP